MPAKSDLTTTQIVSFLTETYGSDVKTEQLLAASDHFGVSYPTICKRLDQYKTGRGLSLIHISEPTRPY